MHIERDVRGREVRQVQSGRVQVRISGVHVKAPDRRPRVGLGDPVARAALRRLRARLEHLAVPGRLRRRCALPQTGRRGAARSPREATVARAAVRRAAERGDGAERDAAALQRDLWVSRHQVERQRRGCGADVIDRHDDRPRLPRFDDAVAVAAGGLDHRHVGDRERRPSGERRLAEHPLVPARDRLDRRPDRPEAALARLT